MLVRLLFQTHGSRNKLRPFSRTPVGDDNECIQGDIKNLADQDIERHKILNLSFIWRRRQRTEQSALIWLTLITIQDYIVIKVFLLGLYEPVITSGNRLNGIFSVESRENNPECSRSNDTAW